MRAKRLLRHRYAGTNNRVDQAAPSCIIPAAGKTCRSAGQAASMTSDREIGMQPTETIQVETETVGCDGGGGALGHPLVYLTLDNGGKADCPYCGRRFVLKEGAKLSHGH